MKTMTTPRTELKAEAVRRMNILGIAQELIEKFEKEEAPIVFDGMNGETAVSSVKELCGRYDPAGEKSLEAKLDAFAKGGNRLIYSIMPAVTDQGDFILNILYVYGLDEENSERLSEEDLKDEWEFLGDACEYNMPSIYALNLDTPEYSEHGSIRVFRTADNGLSLRRG